MELPEGWEWVRLDELFQWSNGKGLTKQQMSNGKHNVYGGNGIAGTHNDWLCKEESIVVGRVGAQCGNVHLAAPYSWVTDNAIYASWRTAYIHLQFFSCLLSNLRLNELAGGSGQPYVSQNILNPLLVPLPPLNEQKRIVAAIESLRERSQKARSALVAIPELCDKFRQSVLAAAFRGDLTADWREQNPDVEWEEVTLEEIIKSKPRNGYSPKPVDFPTKVKSLTLSATTSGKFKPEYCKYINEDIAPDSYLWLNPGDILIQRSNTLDYVGTCAIYDGNFGEFIYPDLMMKIQVIEEKAKPDFVYYALSTQATRQYFKENATGTAGNMPKINQQIVMNTPITLPPINEQVEIVYSIQRSLNAINRIFQEYENTREWLNLLDRSILAKAFRGELVEQDPNDEPASVLLERIRTEREQQTQDKAKKPGRKGQRTIKTQ